MSDETSLESSATEDVKVFNTFDDIIVHALARYIYKKDELSLDKLDLVSVKLDKFRSSCGQQRWLTRIADNVITNEGRPSVRSMFDFWNNSLTLSKHLDWDSSQFPIDEENLENLLDISIVDVSGGGEGGTEDCYSILEYLGVYYRINYSYYSHQGFEFWNGNVFRVYPRKVEIIAWFNTP